jgi:hypothetical protein
MILKMPTTICEERKQLVTFLSKIHVESLGILCPRLNVNKNLVPFEPANESAELLQAWLRYRGFSNSEVRQWTDDKLIVESNKDLRENGNSPTFSGFIQFNPDTASTQFLKLWLSWFGVTSFEERPHKWWTQRVRTIQEMLSKSVKHVKNTVPHVEGALNKLIERRKLIESANNFYFQLNMCFSDYNLQDMRILIGSGLSESEENESEEEEDVELDPVKNRLPTTVVKTSWDKKKVLAIALDASAIAIPLLLSRSSDSYKDRITRNEGNVVSALGIITPKPLPEEKGKLFAALIKKHTRDKLLDVVGQTVGTALFGTNHPSHLTSLGRGLAKDVSSILSGNGEPIPSGVVGTVAKKYMNKHPGLLAGITDVLIPSLNMTWK